MDDLSLFEQLIVLFLLVTSGMGVSCTYRNFKERNK